MSLRSETLVTVHILNTLLLGFDVRNVMSRKIGYIFRIKQPTRCIECPIFILL